MAYRHLIETTTFDFSFTDEAAALSQNSALGPFFENRLAGVIDDTFTEFSDEFFKPGEVVRLERLELDLGIIPYALLHDEIEIRVRERLMAALQQQLGAMKKTGIDEQQTDVSVATEFEQLKYFLIHGCLPWNGDVHSRATIEHLLKKTLHSNALRLINFIKGPSNHQQIISRMIKQFPDYLLSEMVAIFFTAVSGKAILLSQQLERHISRNKPTTSAWQQLREAAWRYIFSQLLQSKKPLPQWQVFLEELTIEIKKLYSEFQSAPLGDITVDVDVDVLQQRLIVAMQGGSCIGFEADWSKLAVNFPDKLKQILLAHGKDIRVWQYLASALPESLLRLIACFSVPEMSGYIDRIKNTIIKLEQQLQVPSKFSFWESTLTYVMLKSSSDLDRRSYLDTLLQQFMQHNQIMVSEQLVMLRKLLLSQLKDQATPAAIVGHLSTGDLNVDSVNDKSESMPRFVIDEVNDSSLWSGELSENSAMGERISIKQSDVERDELLQLLVELDDATLNVVEISMDDARRLEDWLIAVVTAVSTTPLEKHWQELLSNHPDILLSVLKNSLYKTEVRQHVAEIISDSMLQQVVDLIEPDMGLFIAKVADCFSIGLMGDRRSNDINSRLFRELTLACFFVERGSAMHQREYVELLMQMLAVQDDRSYTVLLRTMMAELTHHKKSGSGCDELLTVVDELLCHHDEVPMVRTPFPGDRRVIKTFNPLSFKKSGGVGSVNKIARRYFPLYLRSFQQPLPNSQQDNFYSPQLAVKSPDEHELNEVVDQESMSGQSLESSHDQAQAQAANDMTAHLTLGLKQSQSRQKTGLSSQTSAEQFPDNPKPASVAPEQLSIRRTALDNEDGESVAGGMEERDWPGDVGSQQGCDSIRGYDLDAALRYILLHGSDHGEDVAGQLTIQIKTLATDYPALFLRLYREMQSGEIESEKLLTRLTTAALKEMVAATLAVTYPAGSDLSDFVQALELFAQRAVNENNYYGQVVEHLINDKLIDFEQLAETSGVTVEQGAMADVVPIEVGKAVVEPVLPDDGQQLTTEFVSYLVMSREVTAVNPRRFSMIVERLLTQQPQTFRQTLLTQLIHPFAGQQLALLLPERLLCRLLRLLHRATYEAVLSCGEAITSACYNMQTSTRPSQLRQLMWQFIFQFLFVEGRLFREVHFIRAYVAYLAQQLGRSESRVFNAELLQMLALNIGSLPQQFYQTIVMALNSPVDVAAVHPSRLERRHEIADGSDDQGGSSSVVEDIYIGNAGQVLAAPYLPRLFEMLGLMENSKFKDQAAAERAAHLLQYLVDERCDAPEYQLVLNKILCGVKTGTPIVREITASDSERAAVNGLLQGMIQNWKAVGNTSAAGLRQSFFQREGRLQRNESGWHLLVQPRAYDMLLDQLPWSFALIKQPWMERVLHVEWR